MSSPNVEGTTNPAVVTGGVNGAKLGNKPTEPIGFYGATGAPRASTSTITTLPQLQAYLVSLGLLGP
jgi:hypothetical protein